LFKPFKDHKATIVPLVNHLVFDRNIIHLPNCPEDLQSTSIKHTKWLRTSWILFEPPHTRKKEVYPEERL